MDDGLGATTINNSAATPPSAGKYVPGICWIPAQASTVGSDSHYPEEGPAHDISVDGFWIEPHQVTNAAFAEFVDATGYVTVAECALDPADFPGTTAETCNPGPWCSPVQPGRWTFGT